MTTRTTSTLEYFCETLP